ncbi:ROK family protein [Calothrix sp. 336/3]|uniref:ROK family protein n=1 Tax=Calothrix sp. 336/3 TaxID=1337936 RepID=UPI0009E5786A|nr:ROK family protein [Calothrix sp. 336/3]
MPKIRLLQPGDEHILEAFLVKHAASSMFLRSNLRAVGLENQGNTFQGKYAAAIADGQIVAVATHYWNGMIILQAPTHLESVVTNCLELEKRDIFGISGPANQVENTCKILGFEEKQFRVAEREILFALELCNLRVPIALVTGNVECRLPIPSELELLVEWSVAYQVETLGQALFEAIHGLEANATASVIMVGTGIGAAFYVNGQVLRGTSGWAGELGSIPISSVVGNSSQTLDRLASGAAIVKKLGVDGEQLSALVDRGDSHTLEAIREAGYSLGLGIATVINIFNPSLIVLAGGTLRWSGYLEAAL